MCNRAILKNGGTLGSIPTQYKTQKMCNKTVDNHAHALELVSERYKTQ